MLMASGSNTLDKVLANRAQTQGADVAFRFVRSDNSEPLSITYRELHCQVSLVSRLLRGQIAASDRVMVLHTPGFSFVSAFFACLSARVIAVPYYPPRTIADLPALAAVIAEADPSAILTT